MENQFKYPLLILGALIVISYAHNTGMFAINLSTSDIQFYNKPIVLPFTFTNFTNPEIEVYFNEVRLYDVLIYQENTSFVNITTDETYYEMINKTRNQSIVLTVNKSGAYQVMLENVKSAGLIKLRLIEGDNSEVKSVEVRKPYVRVDHDVPNLVDLNHQQTLTIITKNPQGDDLEADSVDIDVIGPLNDKTTISLDKSGNKFSKTFIYNHDGTYQFKIHARKEGYTISEVTAITSVTKDAGIHPIVYVWIFGISLWILLFTVKLFRRAI